MDIGDTLPDFELFDPDGVPTMLSSALGDRTILILPRYFACLPCQQFMYEANDRLEEIRMAGVEVAAVSAKADWQARWLRDEQGVAYPLLLDPGHQLFQSLGIRRLKPWEITRPAVLRRYAPAFTTRYLKREEQRSRQGIPADPLQLPGVVVVDGERTVTYLHRGEGLGDYPPLDEVVAAAAPAAA